MLSVESYVTVVSKAIDQVQHTQLDVIHEAAELLTEKIANGGVIHVFGTGHSQAFAMELANRAGGLVPFHAISIDHLRTSGQWNVDDPELERNNELAFSLLNLYDLRPSDAAILVSNSGRNGSIIETCLEFHRRGIPVVAVTSMDHTTRVTARHPSGKRLFELADLVIDNCAPLGDAVLEDDRMDSKICAISSVTGAVIAQCLTAEIARRLLERHRSVPILMSANIDGADERNKALQREYEGRI
ncbi:MAG: sugar isomerase domain-containing protein [Bacilli bacterium]